MSSKPPPKLLPRPKAVLDGTLLLKQIVAGRVNKVVLLERPDIVPGPFRLVPDCTSLKMEFTVADVTVKHVYTTTIGKAPPNLVNEINADDPCDTLVEHVRDWLRGNADRETVITVIEVEFERAYNDRCLPDDDPAINPAWREWKPPMEDADFDPKYREAFEALMGGHVKVENRPFPTMSPIRTRLVSWRSRLAKRLRRVFRKPTF